MATTAGETKATDGIQQRLANYAYQLHYSDLDVATRHAAKVRIVDTLGALVGGFFAESSFIARNLVVRMPAAPGASVLGSRLKTTPDMAAFVNGTTARYTEMTDNYQWPGSFGGHTSDVIAPLLGVAEYVHASGEDFINSVVLGYEVYARISDVFHNMGFDHTNFCCAATSVAASKLLALDEAQIGHAIAMAVVPNNALRASRIGHLSMWKVAASGQAGRAGVFAAMLAHAGMEGPHLPFEGKSGWCDHVALERFAIDSMGGDGASYKIGTTSMKLKPVSGILIAAVAACEQIAPVRNIGDIAEVTLEVYAKSLQFGADGKHHWNPDSKESADHSAPYVTAATLMEGAITARSFDDDRLWNPDLRALMQKIKVIENPEFTRAHQRQPSEHYSRVTVVMSNGDRLVGETTHGQDDWASDISDDRISDKFRRLSEEYLGSRGVEGILDRLWNLEEAADVSVIPPAFVIG